MFTKVLVILIFGGISGLALFKTLWCVFLSVAGFPRPIDMVLTGFDLVRSACALVPIKTARNQTMLFPVFPGRWGEATIASHATTRLAAGEKIITAYFYLFFTSWCDTYAIRHRFHRPKCLYLKYIYINRLLMKLYIQDKRTVDDLAHKFSSQARKLL